MRKSRMFLPVVAVVTLVVVMVSLSRENPALAASDDGNTFIGDITLWPLTYVPRDYQFCDGQLLPIMQHTALFSLLGTRYGGDGRATFALPKIPPMKLAAGEVKYIICISGRFPSRN